MTHFKSQVYEPQVSINTEPMWTQHLGKYGSALSLDLSYLLSFRFAGRVY